MKTAFYSTHKFERDFLLQAAGDQHELVLLEPALSLATAPLAAGCEAVCIFVNDDGSAPVLEKLAALGVKYLALRSAGFNHVDIQAAHALGMRIARVPEYSPYAVAEHTVALILALNRKLVRAHNRIRDLNFSLDGLTGFDLHGKTVGIIGMGKIGKIVGQIMRGFGCKIIAFDRYPDPSYEATYLSIDELCRQADIISLHAPLTPETEYIINKQSIAKMKKGVMLINTSRGRLINTLDVTEGLKSGQIGYLGLDVYEEERGLFFEDHSSDIVQDDVISRLITFANVLITSHQAFLTDTALKNIAATTMFNLDCFVKGEKGVNELG
ncbi:2-hydroxyacid dehydrogenase [[Flexibacter] sp. ATCC 35208]|uniref:2-hydroxyacid dehydrogenase n=1 Tax=[Flexibacter] sp. ATCC 35208 TaxID=1936242 RepID=UPI0009C7194F|nr:2-hydroxyacid dehydrogenase [[Flexibacter] sp. ATCC 35208]OMP78896.1 hydroxyacid dehydrogenase [[Flexibacter] sp. ATCC 35208]